MRLEGLLAMKTHFLRYAVIALIALVPFLPGAAQVSAEPAATAALSPPTLGEGAVTNNGLAQRVMLYEEERGNPQGRSAAGTVVWSNETKTSETANIPELVVRADIDIPERRMEMTWRLRRTTGLSTSHTIEFLFKIPQNFTGGDIFNVPGIWMKPAERLQGTALAGLAVKVTAGYFLIELSAADADKQRNLELLKGRPWIDIPIVYTNNRRAILAVEKGTAGEQAFQKAFGAWKE